MAASDQPRLPRWKLPRWKLPRWRLTAGLACLALGAGGIAYPLLWQHHQDVVGQQAVRADRASARAAASDAARAGTACTPRAGPGVLEIPALHLAAPVAQGLSETVLATALGHDPSTAWPGPGASTLIAGHDVGYLSGDASLQPGDTLSYVEPCATLHYTVVGHEITSPGQQASLPAIGGLVLDSCWPTDALWFTPHRYLVIARYVSTTPAAAQPPAIAAPPAVPPVALPAGLSAAQVTLSANPWPMGSLAVTGTPAPSWTASQASLVAEGDALELLFGTRHAVEAGDAAALGALAPGVAVPSWITGTPAAQLDVTETVAGRTLQDVTLRSAVTSPGAPTTFAFTATVVAGGWQVTHVAATS